ncbi:MAG TPA: hypothetical protein VN032_10015 [Thermoanaerobaculia bacterium]|jgi:hypothetical protein|nr:hypothetical protein [Thermoanaerobaculia bacterium]
MRLMARALSLAALLAAILTLPSEGQAPPPTPTPGAPAAATAPTPAPVAANPPAAAPETTPTPSPADLGLPLPTPIAPTAMKIRDIPSIAVEKLPADNPFGKTAETPAVLPAKLVFNDATLPAGFFVSVHVDPAGRPLTVRRDHDPIPSLAAETLKSIGRWTFAPGRRSGQPVDTWGAYRVDLEVEIRSPKIAQMAFTPVTPATPIPKPFEWKTDADWLESRHNAPPQDGSVAIDQVDTAPIPQKTPWSADSFKGPFAVKYWVKVDKAGRIERAIPIEVSDPVLLPYFRRAMGAWVIHPAQSGGVPVDSWNELTLGGQVSYSDDIKQIVALRKSIGP